MIDHTKAVILVSIDVTKTPHYVTGRTVDLEKYGDYKFVVAEDAEYTVHQLARYDAWGRKGILSPHFKDLNPGLYYVDVELWIEAYNTPDGPEGDCGVDCVSVRPYTDEDKDFLYNFTPPEEEIDLEDGDPFGD